MRHMYTSIVGFTRTELKDNSPAFSKDPSGTVAGGTSGALCEGALFAAFDLRAASRLSLTCALATLSTPEERRRAATAFPPEPAASGFTIETRGSRLVRLERKCLRTKRQLHMSFSRCSVNEMFTHF